MKAKYWLLVAVIKAVSSARIHQYANTPQGLLRQSTDGGALGSVLRLRGAEDPQHQLPFWVQLRERFTSIGSSPSSSSPSSVVVVDHRNRGRGMSAVGLVARALKNGLMQSGARVRRRGLLALLAVVCVFSVVGATTSGVVSRPWGGWHTSTRNLVVEPSAEADGGDASPPGRGSNSSERRRRLLKTPQFPLAYMPWWKALRDRRKVKGDSGSRP